jgi:hypothetical protein
MERDEENSKEQYNKKCSNCRPFKKKALHLLANPAKTIRQLVD